MKFIFEKILILAVSVFFSINLYATTNNNSIDKANLGITETISVIYKIINAININDFFNEIIVDGQYNSRHLSDPHSIFVPSDQIHKVMTLNAYMFPQPGNDIIVAMNGPDAGLMNNTLVPIRERIIRQSKIIKKENPDIVFLQEVWGNSNKKHVVEELRNSYPYFYYQKIAYSQRLIDFVSQLYFKGIGYIIEEIIKSTLGLPATVSYEIINDLFDTEIKNPLRMRDGLIIMSKYPILDINSITFNDKIGDENHAEKGALIALIGTPEKPALFVNTHLQSNRSNAAVNIRKNQMQQIGKLLSYYAEKNIPIVVSGDLNEPINYNYKSKVLMDRGNYLANALNTSIKKNYFNTNHLLEFMANHMPDDSYVDFIANINQLKQNNEAIEVWEHTDTKFTNASTVPVEIYDDLIKFASSPFGEYKIDYLIPGINITGIPNPNFKYRTVPDLGQMLDRVILSSQINLNDIKLYRNEFLGGDTNQTIPYNKNISDHTAVLFDINI